MKKAARLTLFALVAVSTTHNLYSMNKPVQFGGDPPPVCDPTDPGCDAPHYKAIAHVNFGGDPPPVCDPTDPGCDAPHAIAGR